jgi:hypothetical protein
VLGAMSVSGQPLSKTLEPLQLRRVGEINPRR